jgi:hypothetical protein
MAESINLYNPFPNITIERRNIYGNIDQRIEIAMKLKKIRWYQNIIEDALNMSRFTTLSKHLRIDNQIVDEILEVKMGRMGNIGLFCDQSPPWSNFDNEIIQFSLDAVFTIKVRNVSNKIQIYLKLLIRFIRKKES